MKLWQKYEAECERKIKYEKQSYFNYHSNMSIGDYDPDLIYEQRIFSFQVQWSAYHKTDNKYKMYLSLYIQSFQKLFG